MGASRGMKRFVGYYANTHAPWMPVRRSRSLHTPQPWLGCWRELRSTLSSRDCQALNISDACIQTEGSSGAGRGRLGSTQGHQHPGRQAGGRGGLRVPGPILTATPPHWNLLLLFLLFPSPSPCDNWEHHAGSGDPADICGEENEPHRPK